MRPPWFIGIVWDVLGHLAPSNSAPGKPLQDNRLYISSTILGCSLLMHNLPLLSGHNQGDDCIYHNLSPFEFILHGPLHIGTY